MTCPSDSANTTDCPAAANPAFDFSGYVNTCRVCIASNADVAGLGIITGIILQTALMNIYVFLWWSVGPGRIRVWDDLVRVWRAVWSALRRPWRIWDSIVAAKTELKEDFRSFGKRTRAASEAANTRQKGLQEGGSNAAPVGHSGVGAAMDPSAGADAEKMTPGRKKFRKMAQKMFRTFSDTQAISGIALLIAALAQGDCLSLYHTAIVIDLISISADGQAIMLFYAYRNYNTDAGLVPLKIDRGIRPRIVSSVLFLILYFVFAFKEYFRYRDSAECFLIPKPSTGRNAGAWGISTAFLVLVVYFPIFLTPKCRQSSIKACRKLIIRVLAPIFREDSSRPADPEQEPASKKSIIQKLSSFLRWPRHIIAWLIYVVVRALQWLHHRELSFPLGTWIYFLWNVVDVGSLKQTNAGLLIGGGEDERNFGAFGQIVPIVMAVALAFPIYDVLQESMTPEADQEGQQQKS